MTNQERIKQISDQIESLCYRRYAGKLSQEENNMYPITVSRLAKEFIILRNEQRFGSRDDKV